MSLIDMVIAQAAKVERLQYLNNLLRKVDHPILRAEQKQLLKEVFK